MLITSVLFHLSRWDLHHFVGNLFYLPVDLITEISVDPLLQCISQYDKKCKCQHYVQHFCTCPYIIRELRNTLKSYEDCKSIKVNLKTLSKVTEISSQISSAYPKSFFHRHADQEYLFCRLISGWKSFVRTTEN